MRTFFIFQAPIITISNVHYYKKKSNTIIEMAKKKNASTEFNKDKVILVNRLLINHTGYDTFLLFRNPCNSNLVYFIPEYLNMVE